MGLVMRTSLSDSFDDTHEFRGELQSATQKVSDLQFRISYSLASQGRIRGKVSGPERLRNELSKLQISADPFLELKTTSPDSFGRRLYSDTASITSTFSTDPQASLLGLPVKQASDDAFFRPIAEISFQSLVVNEKPHHESQPNRVDFYMSGDRIFWRLLLLQVSSEIGDPSLNETGCVLKLADDSPYTVQLIPSDLKRWDERRELRMTKDIWLLRFLENRVPEAGELDDLPAMRRQIVDAISVAVSVATGRKTDFFRIENYSGKTHARIVVSRETFRDMSGYPSPGTLAFASSEMDFLTLAVKNYRTLMAEQLELETPVDYWLRGRMSGDFRERFLLMFLALERLKDMWSKSKGQSYILSDTGWAKLNSSVKSAIKDAVDDPVDRASIYQKTRELNRPSLSSVLTNMMEHYEVRTDDLYPPSVSPTFISTRDRLVHSGDIGDPKRFYKDSVRVQHIVERLFLRMLGWTDVSGAPDEIALPKLQEPD